MRAQFNCSNFFYSNSNTCSCSSIIINTQETYLQYILEILKQTCSLSVLSMSVEATPSRYTYLEGIGKRLTSSTERCWVPIRTWLDLPHFQGYVFTCFFLCPHIYLYITICNEDTFILDCLVILITLLLYIFCGSTEHLLIAIARFNLFSRISEEKRRLFHKHNINSAIMIATYFLITLVYSYKLLCDIKYIM